MLTPFGLGFAVASAGGQKELISLPDLVSAYVFAVENVSVRGAVNAVAPEPVTTVSLRKHWQGFGSPHVFPLPTALLKCSGEMGRETYSAIWESSQITE